MKRSYMDYAMSVIIGRALPDIRDGLKPAHRRVLYGMNDDGAGVEPRLPQVREDRRRGDGQLPSPRRRARSTTRSCAWRRTSTCATCWSTARATSARSTATRRRPCATPRPASTPLADEMMADLDKETVDFVPELRRDHGRAGGPAGNLPQPAGQRLRRHRRRHGDQRPAAQPARGGRRGDLVDRGVAVDEPPTAPSAAQDCSSSFPAPTSPPAASSAAARASSRPISPAAARS